VKKLGFRVVGGGRPPPDIEVGWGGSTGGGWQRGEQGRSGGATKEDKHGGKNVARKTSTVVACSP
jgi:hypothetical protein